MGQVQNYKPVSPDELLNPSPNDWLMYSRTYEAQRFSPLNQITKQNVGQLGLAWTRGLAAGATETIPLVRNGEMRAAVFLRPTGVPDSFSRRRLFRMTPDS
jgi:alcohol dehydrogenase (cytochrome c)